eukprot:4276924-Ditylum_brightwellii.AAC.1
MKKKIGELDEKINNRLNDKNHMIADAPENAFYQDDEDDGEPVEEHHAEGPDDYTPDAYDQMINAEFIMPEGDGHIKGTVIKRKKGQD